MTKRSLKVVLYIWMAINSLIELLRETIKKVINIVVNDDSPNEDKRIDLPDCDQQITVCFNGKGERVDPDEVPVRKAKNKCNRIINFCCTSTVPDGFYIEKLMLVGLCVDVSEINCCLENMQDKVKVPDPCNDMLRCPVDIQAVRLVGCAKIHVSVGALIPKSGVSDKECSVSCNTITCVDQVIAFTCGEKPPCKDCYKMRFIIGKIGLKRDKCGRQVVVVKAKAFLEFTGCGN